MSDKATTRSWRSWKVVRRFGVVVVSLATLTTLAVNLGTIGSWFAKSEDAEAGDAPVLAAEDQCDSDVVRSLWGPDRELFTLKKPAPFPTLNAIIDNPGWEYEPIFVGAKVVGAGTPWCNHVAVQDGDTVSIRAFIENSAANTLVDEDGVGHGAAENTRVRFVADTERSTLVHVDSMLTSDTTAPETIWARVAFESDAPFRLDPIAHAPELISNWHTDGIPLEQDPWSEPGALVGYDMLDGHMPPGYVYSVIVLVKARVTFTG